MAHTWVELEHRGFDLFVLVEADVDVEDGEVSDLRVRRSSGYPVSPRLEDALLKEYSEWLEEQVYETAINDCGY